jgi:hypothetical protein
MKYPKPLDAITPVSIHYVPVLSRYSTYASYGNDFEFLRAICFLAIIKNYS